MIRKYRASVEVGILDDDIITSYQDSPEELQFREDVRFAMITVQNGKYGSSICDAQFGKATLHGLVRGRSSKHFNVLVGKYLFVYSPSVDIYSEYKVVIPQLLHNCGEE